jgi:DNA-binding Lrp family transcriptional regulator
MAESVSIDATDRAVIRALQLAPRGSFSRIGEVLGLSEQTVARRYRRLCGEGVLRVVALVNPAALGQSTWMIRVRCRPDGPTAIADALARRDDVSWVTLGAGGSEVVCSLRSRSRQQRDELLLQRLPRTAPVLDVAASVVLHRFIGERSDDWAPFAADLSAEQTERLGRLGGEAAGLEGREEAGAAGREGAGPAEPGAVAAAAEQAADREAADPVARGRARSAVGAAGREPASPAGRDGTGRADRGPAVTLEPGDEPMLELLSRSGRASYAELAAAAGTSEGRAARRLTALLRAGVIYLDVDLSAPQLGYTAQANLWLTVAPAQLDRAGRTLRGYPEVAYAAAISGPANLTASVCCRDLDQLYRFATASVGAIEGVQVMEISPVLRHVKQAGAILSAGRLMDAPSVPRAARRPRRVGARP